jgi:hypothetical protein
VLLGISCIHSCESVADRVKKHTIPYIPTSPGTFPGWTDRDENIYKLIIERSHDPEPYDASLAKKYDLIAKDDTLSIHSRIWVFANVGSRMMFDLPIDEDARPIFIRTFIDAMSHEHPDIRMMGFNACKDAGILLREDIYPHASKLMDDPDPMVSASARMKIEHAKEKEARVESR